MEKHQNLEIAALIGKFLRSELTAAEAARLEAWVEEDAAHKKLWERLTDPLYVDERLQYWVSGQDKNAAWKRLSAEISGEPQPRFSIARKALRYAAILLPLMVLGGAALYFLGIKGQKTDASLALADVHILPQGKVAQLILANGETVNLNDSLHKAITEKDGTKVQNQASALSYTSGAAGGRRAEMLFNTLITPRGGEYRIVLADGTKVWLNAASSLRYPTQFNGRERKVFLTGEAYFEVAKDAAHPFIVNTGGTDVTVLGTKFNISSYPDDPAQKTTLAEGSVRISDANAAEGGNSVLLKPGNEAVIAQPGRIIRVNKTNVDAALAWKNGMFFFDSESLGSLMRKLSRWYNVDVQYDDGVDTLFHFTGRIQRYEDINGILRLIELTGKVKFTLSGRELHVTK
jgi:ferric-dicitrate binding protein FerR (iron transport regulator)